MLKKNCLSSNIPKAIIEYLNFECIGTSMNYSR